MSIENIELNKFYSYWMQDISAMQQSNEDGASSEQLFTQGALDLLTEAGETENCRTAYDEKGLGTAKQHKINAYSISENYETVDLFISIFKGHEQISKTTNDEIKTAATRISNFFRKAIYSNDTETSKAYKNEYVDEIEETSEIFQFANTLGREKDLRENLVRVNAIILTNGLYTGELPESISPISGYKIFFKIFDLEALYNVSEKSHIPIEINFKDEGFDVPCIAAPSPNEQYQSYLAIIPGTALASIYERFGARLLEQNVRSFLQFSGKINNGIRMTIKNEPHMFLAFNNGIAATADSVEFIKGLNNITLLSSVKDLQIVNGGQTTASIYHTWKKDKADISNIYVQVKLSVVKNKDHFGDIVSRISEYANTQNKVSIADLSSNKPYHVEFEKLSRGIYTPLSDNRTIQTKWFYERARGQYKNARVKEGFTKSRQKAFDLKNPKSQMFTKEELAKYINAYEEIIDGKKILIGPHFVVRGNQKNYIQFINHNLTKKLDSAHFEDSISKAILFKAAEKAYGVKPNSIGDMRYVTVPYTVALLTNLSKKKIDLYKIWRNQAVSQDITFLLRDMMIDIELFIKSTAPGGLYGEWAKKEDCWLKVKTNDFGFDLNTIKNDFSDSKSNLGRRTLTKDEVSLKQIDEEAQRIKSIPINSWKEIEQFGYDSKELTANQSIIIDKLIHKIKNKTPFTDIERETGLKIIDIVSEKAPEIFAEL